MPAQRPPSTNWEPVPIPEAPGAVVWVWYKPGELTDGLVLHVPTEVYRLGLPPQSLSLRRLLHLAGADASQVATWTLAGMTYDGQQGASPLLDQPVPQPPPDGDPNIVVRMEAAPSPMPTPMPQVAAVPATAAPVATADQTALFDRIDLDWQACQLLEKQIDTVRRQLGDMVSRLNSLNRDLSPDERLHADRKDRSDWQTARRWLRDVSTRVAKCIKDQDIGDTSSAGKRNWFEDVYTRQIAPRQPVKELVQIQREFESYRKQLQSLLTQMTTAHSAAANDGERRAKQILQRISASVRSSKVKR